MAKLKDVLEKAGPAPSQAVSYLLGAIAKDDDTTMIRVYPDPQNAQSYVLVKQEDVDGEVVELKPEQAAARGLIGATVYLIPVKVGAMIRVVSVSTHRHGEKRQRDTCSCGGNPPGSASIDCPPGYAFVCDCTGSAPNAYCVSTAQQQGCERGQWCFDAVNYDTGKPVSPCYTSKIGCMQGEAEAPQNHLYVKKSCYPK